jgi:hypothetical protein
MAYANPYANPYNYNPFPNDSGFGSLVSNLRQRANNGDWMAQAALDQMGGGSTANYDNAMSGLSTWGGAWQKFANGNKDSFTRWLTNRYNNYWNDYNLASAKAAEQGQSTPNWLDWLSERNPVMEWNRATPYERGERPADFMTRTRWIR